MGIKPTCIPRRVVIYQCVECGAEIEFASKMNSTKELKTRLRD